MKAVKNKLRTTHYALIASLALMAVSCGQYSSEYKALQAQNDSLRLENVKFTTEVNEMLSTLEEVESNFQAIRDAENYITVQQQAGGELNSSRKERLKQNMHLISETLLKNKEQIADLEARLKKSGIQSASLKKTIDRLTAEVEQKAVMIAVLQEDLTKKNIRIDELDSQVAQLNEDMEELATTSNEQQEKLKAQDKILHTAHYCFGTKKELKAQNILTRSGLFSKTKALQDDFNKDYFMTIDTRETKQIKLYTHKAKLHSNHPDDSYKLIEDVEGNLTLQITDENAFWSLGKYLVIEVD